MNQFICVALVLVLVINFGAASEDQVMQELAAVRAACDNDEANRIQCIFNFLATKGLKDTPTTLTEARQEQYIVPCGDVACSANCIMVNGAVSCNKSTKNKFKVVADGLLFLSGR